MDKLREAKEQQQDKDELCWGEEEWLEKQGWISTPWLAHIQRNIGPRLGFKSIREQEKQIILNTAKQTVIEREAVKISQDRQMADDVRLIQQTEREMRLTKDKQFD